MERERAAWTVQTEGNSVVVVQAIVGETKKQIIDRKKMAKGETGIAEGLKESPDEIDRGVGVVVVGADGGKESKV